MLSRASSLEECFSKIKKILYIYIYIGCERCSPEPLPWEKKNLQAQSTHWTWKELRNTPLSGCVYKKMKKRKIYKLRAHTGHGRS